MPPKRALNSIVKSDASPTNDKDGNKKRKLSTTARTGQACDRCKTRKIRCDGRIGGCSPCSQNRTECKTTDRITGRATSRGYVSDLEQCTRDQDSRIRELEARLINMGVHVTPSKIHVNPENTPLADWNLSKEDKPERSWEDHGHLIATSDGSPTRYPSSASAPLSPLGLPKFRTGLTGENYLGVSSGNSFLSSIRGTSLNVLGMEINLAGFASDDLDESDYLPRTEPLRNKSYQSFIQTAFGQSPIDQKPDLMPKEEGFKYIQWYFKMVNTFMPILHKSTFISLLTRVYDDPTFEASAAESAMVHMAFAIMFFQVSSRASENSAYQSMMNERSNSHYHYALHLLPQLMASHSIQDVQALALMSAHVRNFPKPGAAWMMTNMTFNLAIELGLHRSAKRWASTTPKKSILEIEMRKRVFWSIMLIHVNVSSKLGRPMALRIEDFDVEIPEAVDDDFLDEVGIEKARQGKCSFLAAIEEFKTIPLAMELYSNIYAVKRSPQTYINTVRRLEHRMRQWQEQLPVELIQSKVAADDREGQVIALYMNMRPLEFQLQLRHPSLSLTDSAQFNNENLTVCMEVSRQMLHCVKELQKYKSLDTSWFQGAVYVLAITTTLFGNWEQRDQITSAGLQALKGDMDSWLSIMGDIGGLFGSGTHLQDAVRVTVDSTMNLLTRYFASKTASSALSANQIISPSSTPLQGHAANQVIYNHPNRYQAYQGGSHGTSGNMEPQNRGSTYPPPEKSHLTGHDPRPYPSATQYSYPEPSSAGMTSYTDKPRSFDPMTYPGGARQQHTSAQQAAAAAAFFYENSIPSAATYTPHNPNLDGSNSQAWRQWTDTMASNVQPQQEYISSASALMQLGARNDHGPGPSVAAAGGAEMPGTMGEDMSRFWHPIIFEKLHQDL